MLNWRLENSSSLEKHMSILLWIVAVLLILVGGIWIIATAANAPMLEVEEKGYKATIMQEKDESMQAYRSMQATDAYFAKESNARNWYFSRLLLGLGVLLLLAKLYPIIF